MHLYLCSWVRNLWRSADLSVVELTALDIPGADLPLLYDQYTVAALRWCLVCRGYQVPTCGGRNNSLTGIYLVQTLNLCLLTQYLTHAESNKLNKRVTVSWMFDSSYLYREYRALIDSGKNAVLPTHPPPPMTGWLLITEENYITVSLSVPLVTTGNQSCAFLYLFYFILLL